MPATFRHTRGGGAAFYTQPLLYLSTRSMAFPRLSITKSIHSSIRAFLSPDTHVRMACGSLILTLSSHSRLHPSGKERPTAKAFSEEGFALMRKR